MLLEARDIEVRYGSVRAVRGVSLRLAPGEIVAVLGANGAGKSSLLRALLGLTRPHAGEVVFTGNDITRWSTSARVRAGLVLVPEGRRIVASLTVHENLLMAPASGAMAPPCMPRSSKSISAFPIWRPAGTRSRRCSPAASSRCSLSAAP